MIDGRFDQHFLELFAHRQRRRPQGSSVPPSVLAGLVLAVVLATLGLVWVQVA